MKLLLYCTKAKPYLYFAQESRTLMEIDNSFEGYKTTHKNVDDYLNGKIVAECDFEVEEICSEKLDTGVGYEPLFYTESIDDISKQSCLRQFEIENYLGCKANGEVVGYAIHIKNLHIFNEFKELSDYIHTFISCSNYEEIKKIYDEKYAWKPNQMGVTEYHYEIVKINVEVMER